MAPFEALYGSRYRSPIGRFESTKPRLRGTNLIQEALERVRVIQDSFEQFRAGTRVMLIIGGDGL